MSRTQRAILHSPFLQAAVVSALLAGCGSNDNASGPPGGGRPLERNEFRLEFSGLGDPTPAHYEIWFVIDGVTRSGGKFRVQSDGAGASSQIVDLAGQPIADGILRAPSGVDPSAAADAFVSIEPDNDASPQPSSARLLGGTVAGGRANLAVAHARGLNVSFTSASGSYILDTPTTETVKDFNRGIAWLVPGDAGATAGLVLPALPATGWTYEGWVTRPTDAGTIAYSTGRFPDVDGFDLDRAGSTAGTFGADEDGNGKADGFPFPAQDFVDSSGNIPPLVLDGGGIGTFISVEPSPDNSAGPFFIRPLAATIAEGSSRVTLSVPGLGPIGAAHYEAWARIDGVGNVSIGRFRVDASGALRNLDGSAIDAFTVTGDLLLSSRVFVTVEPEGDSNSEPSRSRVLDGRLIDSTATLSADSLLSGRASFSNETFRGAYFLNTFTTVDTTDFGSGIWFFNPSMGELDADSVSFVVPILRDGWQFAGWIERISDGAVFSTGAFLTPDRADRDLAGLTAGTFGDDVNGDGRADGPRFPGQDFVRSTPEVPAPFDLDGGDFRVFVTVEPFPDIDAGPFPIRLFEDAVVESLGVLRTQPLARPIGGVPSGSVLVSRGPTVQTMNPSTAGLPSGAVFVSDD